MNASQVDRRVTAMRARSSTKPARVRPVRHLGQASLSYGGRNRSATRMTGAQRNSIGRTSEWSMSPYAPKGGWR